MSCQPALGTACHHSKASFVRAPGGGGPSAQCAPGHVCAAAGRRGAQRGGRQAPLLEQRSRPQAPPPDEASWESALIGRESSSQPGAAATSRSRAALAPREARGGDAEAEAGYPTGFGEELTAEERAEWDAEAQELAAAEALRMGVSVDRDPGGLGDGLFNAQALLAAADAAERGRGGAPGDGEASAAVRSGGRRRAGSPQEPREKEIPIALLPKVAIVGRPNVGKSALVNRLSGANTAIVYDYPGVTRDRLYTRAAWGASEFVIVDTGGLVSDAGALPNQPRAAPGKPPRSLEPGLPQAIERQAAAGAAEADVLVMVVDGQVGITAADEEISTWLRRTHPRKPILLAVNKCENARLADIQAAEFWTLGMEPVAISAISGSGTGDLLDRLVAALPAPRPQDAADAGEAPLAVAIIGRPNVGKSSLLNALAGSERAIVSPVAGTTRDAVDTEVVAPDGRRYTLIDTAGIRKRARVSDSVDGAEPLSVGRAIGAVRRAEVVLLVLDGQACAPDGRLVVAQQDFRLAELVAAQGRACVLVVNKWDAVADKDSDTLARAREDLLQQLRPLAWAPVVFTSAVTGQRVGKLLEAAAAASAEHRRRVSTATLNLVLREASNWRSPPTARGSPRKGRIYYATQAATRPPTFVCFVNDASLFTEEYRRFLERQLRDNVGFPGTPLRVFFRGKAPRANPGGGRPAAYAD